MAMIQLRPVFGYLMVRNAQLNERKIVKYYLRFPRSLSNKNIEIVEEGRSSLTQDEERYEANKGTDGDGIHNETRRTDQKQITEKKHRI